MTLKIRLAAEPDIPVIAALADEIWKEYYPAIITRAQIDYMLEKMYSAAELGRQMREEGHTFYLIAEEVTPVGYLSIQETGPASRDYFLHKFYILASSRGMGAGGHLFARVLGDLASQGAACIRLCVNRQNVKAVNFYFKSGFTIEKAIDADIGGGFFMNDFVMVRKVNL